MERFTVYSSNTATSSSSPLRRRGWTSNGGVRTARISTPTLLATSEPGRCVGCALRVRVRGAGVARIAVEQRALVQYCDQWVRAGCDLESSLITQKHAALVRTGNFPHRDPPTSPSPSVTRSSARLPLDRPSTDARARCTGARTGSRAGFALAQREHPAPRPRPRASGSRARRTLSGFDSGQVASSPTLSRNSGRREDKANVRTAAADARDWATARAR